MTCTIYRYAVLLLVRATLVSDCYSSHSDAGCVGRATGGVVYPGINNLADYNNNDAMSSFRCTN